jgi:tRNA A-37 threonylcarbamoyl transferase component Bud32
MTDRASLHGALKRELDSRFKGYSWERVKSSSKRSVYHLTKQGYPGVYLKIYHPRDLFQRIRNLIFPRTQKEADILKDIALSGIHTAEVLAHFCHGTSSAIALNEVENSRLLIHFEKDFQVKMLFSAAKDLLEHGFVHDDLHPGNILIDNKNNYILIDCYEVKKKVGNRLLDRIKSFALIASVFGTSLPEIKMLLPAENERTIGSIALLAENIRRKRVKRWIRRSLFNGSFSRIEKSGDYHAIIRRDENLDLKDRINVHRNNLRTGSNLLKVQEKTQVTIVGAYCVKTYKKSLILLEPYALRSWKGSLILMFNGFRVAEPVACIVFNDKSSMFISKKLKYPQLDRLLSSGKLDGQENKNLAASIGRTIGRMHMLGIFHADLKACNMFIERGMNEVIFIDTDRVVQLRYISREKRLRNLVQIGLSIPRTAAISGGRAMIDAYAAQTGDRAVSLIKEIKMKIEGKEIVYTTDEGDQFEVF